MFWTLFFQALAVIGVVLVVSFLIQTFVVKSG